TVRRSPWRSGESGEGTLMKVGILGSGEVARALGAGFLGHGHELMLGTRDLTKLKDWQRQNPRARVGSFAEAAVFGELVVLAVKGSVAAEVLRAASDGLGGKTLIDATNPIADVPPTNGVLKFFTNLDESLMERMQTAFPKVHFVKAFNSVGSPRMVNPQYSGVRPTMFICGDDAEAAAGRGPTVGSIRLGSRGYGSSGGGARDRASMHALVHPRLSAQPVDTRFQAVEIVLP